MPALPTAFRQFLDSRRGRGAAWLAAYLLLLAYYATYRFHGFNLWDEGAHPHAAVRILSGERPYADFMANPPGTAMLQAVFFQLLGPSIRASRIMWWLLAPVVPMLTFFLSKRLMGPIIAACVVALAAFAPGPAFNREIALMLLGNLTVVAWAVKDLSGRRLFLMGTFAGLTSMFRWDSCGFAGVMGGAILAADFIDRLIQREASIFSELRNSARQIGSMLAGWLVGGSYYVFFTIVDPEFRYHLLEVIWQLRNNAYAESGYPFPDLTWLGAQEVGNSLWETGKLLILGDIIRAGDVFFDGLWYSSLDPILLRMPVVFYVLGALCCLGLWLRTASRETRLLSIGVVVLATLSYNQVYWRTGVGNLWRVIIPVLIVGGFVTHTLMTMLRGFRGSILLRGFVIVTALSCWLLVALYAIATPNGYEIGAITARWQNDTLVHHPRIGVWMDRYSAGTLDFVEKQAAAHTSPGEPIFVVPLAPVFYLLADRPNPTRHEWMMGWWWKGAFKPRDVREQEIIEVLEAAEVPLIFHSDYPMDGGDAPRFRDYTPFVFAWMEQNCARLTGGKSFYHAYICDFGPRSAMQPVGGLAIAGIDFGKVELRPGGGAGSQLLIGPPGRVRLQMPASSTQFSARLVGFQNDDAPDTATVTIGRASRGRRMVTERFTWSAAGHRRTVSVDTSDFTEAETLFIEIEAPYRAAAGAMFSLEDAVVR